MAAKRRYSNLRPGGQLRGTSLGWVGQTRLGFVKGRWNLGA